MDKTLMEENICAIWPSGSHSSKIGKKLEASLFTNDFTSFTRGLVERLHT